MVGGTGPVKTERAIYSRYAGDILFVLSFKHDLCILLQRQHRIQNISYAIGAVPTMVL